MASRDVGTAFVTSDTAPELPFAFCRRHGVFVQSIGERSATIVHRTSLSTALIAELARFLERPLEFVWVDEQVFERQLASALERDPEDTAERIIDDLDESGDLTELLGQIPNAGDLLESVEEAPVVRLVNAILTRAVREGALPTFTSSPMKAARRSISS